MDSKNTKHVKTSTWNN